MSQGRRRRRVSPYRRIAPVLGWTVAAGVLVLLALVFTGRSWTLALAVAASGIAVVGLVVVTAELTGLLRSPSPPIEPEARVADDDGDDGSAPPPTGP